MFLKRVQSSFQTNSAFARHSCASSHLVPSRSQRTNILKCSFGHKADPRNKLSVHGRVCKCKRAYTIYRWINSFWAIAATSEGMVAVKDLQNACHAPHFLLIRDWILGQSFQQVCWSCWYGSCHPDPPCSLNIWRDWIFLLHIKLGMAPSSRKSTPANNKANVYKRWVLTMWPRIAM